MSNNYCFTIGTDLWGWSLERGTTFPLFSKIDWYKSILLHYLQLNMLPEEGVTNFFNPINANTYLFTWTKS